MRGWVLEASRAYLVGALRAAAASLSDKLAGDGEGTGSSCLGVEAALTEQGRYTKSQGELL